MSPVRARRHCTCTFVFVVSEIRPSIDAKGDRDMPATATQNPISDLMYDWLTVLQSKAEGLNAYEQYIQDAEKEGAQECVQMFRKLHDADVKQVQEIRDHVMHMMSAKQGR
jgi:hypothetical protein